MLKTFENANIAYNLKKKNLLLYNVLQGNNRERMQEWFNKMNEIPLDGWSVALKKPTDNNPLTLAQTLLFLKENGVKKNVHLLAISGKTLTPLLFYFKEYIKNLTFDSSSYINKKLPTSYFLRDNKNLLLFGQSLNHKLTKIPCDCGVCKNIEINDLKLDDGPTIVSLIALHNLRVMLDEYNILDSLVSDKDIFKQYIKSKKMEETYIALEFIDYGLENGLKKAEHKFEQYLNKRIITKEQSTLFKF
jgi:queuine/archaeosine tRNA-ribosyltransferase